jgi:hypothetical protein
MAHALIGEPCNRELVGPYRISVHVTGKNIPDQSAPDGQITSPPCLDLPALSSPSVKNISVFQKRKSVV